MDCQPTPEVRNIIRAMARAKVREGMEDHLDILDAIHSEIHEHTPLWKNEIADIISGYGDKKPATQNDLQVRFNRLKTELRDMRKQQDVASGKRDDGRSEARAKQIDKQLTEIQRKLDAGDFSKKVREKPIYSEAVKTKQAELEMAKKAVTRELKRIEYQNFSPTRKAVDFGASAMRDAILTSPTVIEHLAGASFWRLASTGLEEGADALMRTIPAYRRLSDKAPVEGGGFIPSAHAKGALAVFSKDTLIDMRDKIMKGMTRKAAIYGKDHHTNYPLMDLISKAHDVIKTPLERYAFARAYERQTVNMRRSMKQSGKSASEVSDYMALDSTDAKFEAKAYAESQKAKLQGDNGVANWLNNTFATLEKAGDLGATVSAVLRTEMPIVKIPLNYASEFASYGYGGLKALSRSRLRAKEGAPISPEDADYIVRNIKKQAVGPALYAIGYMFASSFGGLYQDGKKPGKIKFGDANIDGVAMSHHLTHSPMWGVMQAGATAAHAEAEDRKKGYGKVGRIIDGAAQANVAMLLDVPVFDLPKDLQQLRGGLSSEKLLGKKAAQFIPAILGWEAKREDSDSKGEPVKRKPRGFGDELRVNVPGLRKQVPRE